MNRVINLGEGLIVLVITAAIMAGINYAFYGNTGEAFDAFYYSMTGFLGIFYILGKKVK